MKTYSVFAANTTSLLDSNKLIIGSSPKAALERAIGKKTKRTTDNFAIDYIVEEVKPCACGNYTRLAGKPRLCYTTI